MTHYCSAITEIMNGDGEYTEKPCGSPAVFSVRSVFMNDLRTVCALHLSHHVPWGGTLFVTYIKDDNDLVYDASLT